MGGMGGKKRRDVLDGVEPAVLAFYEREIGTVEIANEDDSLERMYFRLPKVARHISSRARHRLLWDVARDDSKLRDFMEKTEDLLDEMHHRARLENISFFKYVGRHEIALRNASFLLAVLINLLLLVGLAAADGSESEWRYEEVRLTVLVAGAIQTATSSLVVLIYLVTQAPLLLRQHWRERVRPASTAAWAAQSAVVLLQRPYFTFQLLYVVFAVLGNVVHEAFFSYHLLDVVTRSETLRSVTQAVTANAKAIMLTMILGLVWMWMYALVGFVVFRDDYDLVPGAASFCSSAWECVVTVTNWGLRSSGGIGDQMELHPYTPNDSVAYGRVVFDLSFFLVMCVLWLNIILGLIIDTFSALRQEKEAIQDSIANACFICGLSRDVLTRVGPGFLYHTRKEHNVFMYVFMIDYLRSKDYLDLTGREGYVLAKFEARDTSFFPKSTLSVRRP